MGFEPMISVLERTKTVHASDSVATVIGDVFISKIIIMLSGRVL
jgi:hypothetical protein